jgi:hypothetical protein
MLGGAARFFGALYVSSFAWRRSAEDDGVFRELLEETSLQPTYLNVVSRETFAVPGIFS